MQSVAQAAGRAVPLKRNEAWEARLHALGETIHTLRRRQKRSQDEVAGHCGFHRAYLSAIERGERNPTFLTVVCIAEALEMTASDLLREAGV